MAKSNPTEPTETHPYKSLSANFYVDPANHLAELICKKKAEDENMGTLPQFFWKHDKFKNLYVREISQARKLLKEYDHRAVSAAIRSPKAKWIRSLRNSNLLPIIKEEEKKLDKRELGLIETKQTTTHRKPHKKYRNPMRDV